MNFFRFFICLLLLILLLNCADGAGVEEDIYKKSAIKLSAILKALHDIPILKAVEKKGDLEVIYFDNSKRQEYLLTKKGQILDVKSQLQVVASTFPEGKWASDANFCIALMITSLFYPFPDIFSVDDNELQIILENNMNFALDDWTKITLKPYYRLFLDRQEGKDKEIIGEPYLIKAGFYSLLISHLCQYGHFERANSLILRLKSQGFPSQFINDLVEIVAQYKSLHDHKMEETGKQN
jgi:pentatricopeptide repeat protein